jgi:hypothetical protein
MVRRDRANCRQGQVFQIGSPNKGNSLILIRCESKFCSQGDVFESRKLRTPCCDFLTFAGHGVSLAVKYAKSTRHHRLRKKCFLVIPSEARDLLFHRPQEESRFLGQTAPSE